MLGSGRPFLLEIQNARNIPSEESVKFLETKINNLEKKLVSSLPNQHCCFSCHWAITKEHIMDAGRCEKSETGRQSVVGTDAWRRSRETGLFFFYIYLFIFSFPLLLPISCWWPVILSCICTQKQYTALVWISRPLKDEDLQSISSLEDMVSYL